MLSTPVTREEGMGKDTQLPYTIALFVIVLLALSISHAIEIFIKIFRRFRSYRGMYFYSLIAASLGIVLHAIGYFVRNYSITKVVAVQISLACSGGVLMVTGQSIVMWSRLHLISSGKQDMWLLYVILADCIILQGGATTLFAGSNSSNPAPFLKIYKTWEGFQVTWFFIQESLISGLYIYRTVALLQSSFIFRVASTKRILIHLIVVNVLVVLLDVTIIAFQYADLYQIQTAWKTLAYAIKLRLEFSILNQLVDFTKMEFTGHTRSGSRQMTINEEGSRYAARQSVGGSRFKNSNYSRMDDDNITLVPSQSVLKTTEIKITVEVEECDIGFRDSWKDEPTIEKGSLSRRETTDMM